MGATINFVVEVSRSMYDFIRDGKENSFHYTTTNHLPKFPLTLKDLPDNIANRLEGIATGDSIIFHCEYPTGEYSTDIEKKVIRVEEDTAHHQKILHFAKERMPAWKRR